MIGFFLLQALTMPINVDVDASQAGRYLFQVHETIPAQAGPFTVVYPKWIPGNHRPTGPIIELTALHFSVNGKEIPWTRDGKDMFAFHLDLPAGTESLVADFAEASTPGQSGTPVLARISFHRYVLYPADTKSDDVLVKASLTLPPGWDFGTPLPIQQSRGSHVEFRPASLTTLVDSPIVAGKYFKKIVVDAGPPLHEIDVAADWPIDLEIKPEIEQSWKNLVKETGALFGARHYRDYHWLVTLSEFGAYMGLEHHECSEDGVGAAGFKDSDRIGGLVSHEFTHSWNGKYMRPAGLATPNYQEPMKGDLLWVYEGLTQYLGMVLAARSGFSTQESFRQNLASLAAALDRKEGRTWRPLEDTAVSVQISYASRGVWSDSTRGADYYNEGVLCWLEADTLIRRLSGGTKSLNDFCRAFYGGKSGPPEIHPYSFEDIVAALNAVQPYDWGSFWRERLDRTGVHAPLGGIAHSGWSLVYTDKSAQGAPLGYEYPFGVTFSKDGAVEKISPGSPAFAAGFAPGMKVTGLNGRAWAPDLLVDAVRNKVPLLTFNVDQSGFLSTLTIRYKGGLMIPHLVRDAAKPDLLAQILTPGARN